MPELSKDTTPEQIYAYLRTMEGDGVLTYILPTTPLGEEWVVGMFDGGLLKLNHEQVIAFLIGNQLTLQWLMGQLREKGAADLVALLNRPGRTEHVLAEGRSLTVSVTDEGVIFDGFKDGEPIGTHAMTFDEAWQEVWA